jgi:hypothetical protein
MRSGNGQEEEAGMSEVCEWDKVIRKNALRRRN